jgi:hypothetical protein
LFWLPNLVARKQPDAAIIAQEKSVLEDMLLNRLVDTLLQHVSAQVTCFAWPSVEVVTEQYQKLIDAWVDIVRRDTKIQETIFTKPEQSSCSFNWAEFWRLAHTDKRFAPEGSEAAFFLFHFSGMWGVATLI